MSLSTARVGDAACVAAIAGNDEVRRHLANMGFAVGAVVTVVQRMGGNLIVKVKDSRVAVNRELAELIGLQEGM